MAFTKEIAVELVLAIRDQMERCPACFGAGKVRQSGDYQQCFCLVCEDIARVMYRIDRGWYEGYVPPLENQKIYDHYKELLDKAAVVARDFAKRCPGCYGIGKVWAGDRPRKCFVCERLHGAIDAYTAAADPSQPTPSFTPAMTGPQGINRREREDDDK